MTKETTSELDEVLNYKLELNEKIKWNKNENLKISLAINSTGYVKDLEKLKRLEITGEKLVTMQTKEITKLSNVRIAKELGTPYHIVRWKWDEMVRMAA